MSIHFSLRGEPQEISSARARELLRIPQQEVRLHQLCYPKVDQPRCPSADVVRPCFRSNFGEGSSQMPHYLTPTTRPLYAVMRQNLLLREGFVEGLTCLQQWLLFHLVRQIPFDI